MRILIVPESWSVEEGLAVAHAQGLSAILRGIPPKLAAVVSPEVLPAVYAVPDEIPDEEPA